MIGTFENFKVTHGSFGQQCTTIDGQTYLTWFDGADPSLRGLGPGAKVEYEARPAPAGGGFAGLLCESLEVALSAAGG
jgi:hypothetical protein